MNDLPRWAQLLQQERDNFLDPSPAPKRRRPVACPANERLKVELIVRQGRLAPDTLFTHTSRSVSRLEARLEAEKAARAAGWPVIGRVHQIVRC